MYLGTIRFQFPNIKNVYCAFQTRHNGFSKAPYAQGNISLEVGDNPADVAKTRALICPTFDVKHFADLTQVHSVKTLFEPDPATPEQALPTEADGMATIKTDFALAVKAADCQPILICNDKGTHIMALHAGWRGNKQNYPYIAVTEFCEHYKLKANSLFAVRGPSLSPAAAEFINYDTEWGQEFNTWFNQKNNTMDLWELTRQQLQKAGLPSSHIYGIDLCTYANSNDFFSFRQSNTTGRQASFIYIKN